VVPDTVLRAAPFPFGLYSAVAAPYHALPALKRTVGSRPAGESGRDVLGRVDLGKALAVGRLRFRTGRV
jgi:hypothetical protein